MSLKTLIKATLLFFVNLFAFLSVGYILDWLFGGRGRITIVCLVLSIIPLFLILMRYYKGTMADINAITPNDSIDEHNGK